MRRKRKMVEVVPEQFARVRALLIKNAGIVDPQVAAFAYQTGGRWQSF